MSDYSKRDPANVPQEVKNYMYKKLFGDKDENDGHETTVGLFQADALVSGDSAAGTGYRDRDGDSTELLEAVKLAYRKHHLGDDSIGWDELSEKLQDVLCEAMGDEAFQAWIEPYGQVPEDV